RRYGLACLTYLVLVFNPPGIHRRPGGPNRAAQGIGKILDNSEILRTFKPPSPRNDDARFGELQFLAPGSLDSRDPRTYLCGGKLRCKCDDLPTARWVGRGDGENIGTQSCHC